MLDKFKILKDFRLLIIVTLVFAITFETLQQQFYINRFDLGNVTFFELLKNQAYRWFIWLGFALVLINYQIKLNSENRTKGFIKLVLLIFCLVLSNIIIISFIQMLINGDSFKLKSFSLEYIQFFIYQKAPVYTLGYIAITTILHLKLKNEKLLFDVQKLSELKEVNSKLYNQLQNKIEEKASVLNIKIGNKRKLIPVDSITWIESDDYCVKVHTIDRKSFSMRTSLKTLNEKLDTNFMRVHRKAIVNMQLVKEVNLSNRPELIIEKGLKIPISKSYIKLVRDFLS